MALLQVFLVCILGLHNDINRRVNCSTRQQLPVYNSLTGWQLQIYNSWGLVVIIF